MNPKCYNEKESQNQTFILIFVNSAHSEHSNTKFTFVSPGFVKKAKKSTSKTVNPIDNGSEN